jgi:hypothetical protein
MASELTQQPFRQVHREADHRAADAKSVNPVAQLPDAAWWTAVGNPGGPAIPAGASIPTNEITAQLASDDVFVAMAPGTSFANVLAPLFGASGLRPPANSERPTIAPGSVGQVNAIAARLERTGEAP